VLNIWNIKVLALRQTLEHLKVKVKFIVMFSLNTNRHSSILGHKIIRISCFIITIGKVNLVFKNKSTELILEATSQTKGR